MKNKFESNDICKHPNSFSENHNPFEPELQNIFALKKAKSFNNHLQKRSFTQIVKNKNIIDKLIIDKKHSGTIDPKINKLEYKIKHIKRPKNFTILDFIPFTHKICAFDNIQMQIKRYIENNCKNQNTKQHGEDDIIQTESKQHRMTTQNFENQVSTLNIDNNKKIGEKLIMKLKDSTLNICGIKKRNLSKLYGIGKININNNRK